MDAPPPFLDSLGEYPRWFVVACLAVVAAVGLWIVAKILKWTLYLLIAAILVGGIATAVWLFFH